MTSLVFLDGRSRCSTRKVKKRGEGGRRVSQDTLFSRLLDQIYGRGKAILTLAVPEKSVSCTFINDPISIQTQCEIFGIP